MLNKTLRLPGKTPVRAFAPLSAQGFTLVEMAVVMVILALLAGGLLIPLATQVENSRREKTQEALSYINEALIGYAMVNRRLPCPDTNGDGLENACAGGSGNFAAGTLPWLTLSITGSDPWGNTFRYAVNGAFSDSVTYFTLASTGTGAGILNIDDAANCVAPQAAAGNVPAVIWSTAKSNTTSAFEAENTDNDNCFVYRDYSSITGSEYDDQITWVSSSILFNRMVAAGKLP